MLSASEWSAYTEYLGNWYLTCKSKLLQWKSRESTAYCNYTLSLEIIQLSKFSAPGYYILPLKLEKNMKFFFLKSITETCCPFIVLRVATKYHIAFLLFWNTILISVIGTIPNDPYKCWGGLPIGTQLNPFVIIFYNLQPTTCPQLTSSNFDSWIWSWQSLIFKVHFYWNMV